MKIQLDPKVVLELAERSLRNDLNQLKNILKNPSVTSEAKKKNADLPEDSLLDAMEDHLQTQYNEGLSECWEDFKSQYDDYCEKCPDSELQRKVNEHELIESMKNAIETIDKLSQQLS